MVVGICDDHAEERERIYKVCEMVFGKSRKTHLRLQKKHGCANMDKALNRYIIHAVWKRKKMTVS